MTLLTNFLLACLTNLVQPILNSNPVYATILLSPLILCSSNMAAHMMVPCISHRTWLTYVINYFQIFVGHTYTLSELLTVNLQPAPKVMLTNHNSDYLDLVSNCNTYLLYLQQLSTASVTSSIASKASETLSTLSGCRNFIKKTIFLGALCTARASCASLTAYQTLSSLTSPTPTVSQQFWLHYQLR